MAEADFQGHSLDGAGYDWPIRYQDLAPYYDESDAYIGVYGTAEHIPSAPDGVFQPPPLPRCSDVVIQSGCKKLGIPCIPGRAAILTRSLNGRPPCHYCNQCERGCILNSNFSSSQTLIATALTWQSDSNHSLCHGREILVGADGKARAASYIDKITRTEQRVQGTAPSLSAPAHANGRSFCCDWRGALFPNGLANSSGAVGRYLMDTPASGVLGCFPQLAKLPAHNHDGTGSVHVYVPWWKYKQTTNFSVATISEIYGGRNMPRVGMFNGVLQEVEGYGGTLKQSCRRNTEASSAWKDAGRYDPE